MCQLKIIDMIDRSTLRPILAGHNATAGGNNETYMLENLIKMQIDQSFHVPHFVVCGDVLPTATAVSFVDYTFTRWLPRPRVSWRIFCGFPSAYCFDRVAVSRLGGSRHFRFMSCLSILSSPRQCFNSWKSFSEMLLSFVAVTKKKRYKLSLVHDIFCFYEKVHR